MEHIILQVLLILLTLSALSPHSENRLCPQRTALPMSLPLSVEGPHPVCFLCSVLCGYSAVEAPGARAWPHHVNKHWGAILAGFGRTGASLQKCGKEPTWESMQLL